MVVHTEISEQSSSSTYNYDVFLSFRGADTRSNFTDHLLKALQEATIDTFFDDAEIKVGDFLKPELESAIKSSRASIIVLSKNYASSTWCLDELALIMEQKTTSKHIVFPIFYHVKPSDVRKQRKSFEEAMAEHKKRMNDEINEEKRSQWGRKIKQWENALGQVADLKGEEANGSVTAYEIKDDAQETGELDYVNGAALVRYLIAGNFLGLPAVTVPVGYDRLGLPIGIQFIGKPWSEAKLLQIAYAMEALCEAEYKKPQVFYDLLGEC